MPVSVVASGGSEVEVDPFSTCDPKRASKRPPAKRELPACLVVVQPGAAARKLLTVVLHHPQRTAVTRHGFPREHEPHELPLLCA